MHPQKQAHMQLVSSFVLVTKRPLIPDPPLPPYATIPPSPQFPTRRTRSSLSHLGLLLRKLRLPNLIPPQNNIQHPLHITQQLLIRLRSTPLEISDNGRRCVALGREILLRHRRALVVLGFGARLGDGLADYGAHRLGLDDVVGAVDFG